MAHDLSNVTILYVVRVERPGVDLASQCIWRADKTNVVDLQRAREDRAFDELRRELQAASRETRGGP